MGFTRPTNHAILKFEADGLGAFSSSRLFVMPMQAVRKDGRKIPLHTALPERRGALIRMPMQEPSSNSRGKSSIQFRGNNLEYWPRGYPSHDDL
jgi:hypothetical protein